VLKPTDEINVSTSFPIILLPGSATIWMISTHLNLTEG
jgi:hypothetical protein